MLSPGIAPLFRLVGKSLWRFISLHVYKTWVFLTIQIYFLVIQNGLFPIVLSCSFRIKWYTQLSANKPSRSTSRWAARSSFALVQLMAPTARQNPAPPPNFWIFWRDGILYARGPAINCLKPAILAQFFTTDHWLWQSVGKMQRKQV